eukprot:2330186-Rhodomonas_salina.1
MSGTDRWYAATTGRYRISRSKLVDNVRACCQAGGGSSKLKGTADSRVESAQADASKGSKTTPPMPGVSGVAGIKFAGEIEYRIAAD